jgi:hypothetical protein
MCVRRIVGWGDALWFTSATASVSPDFMVIADSVRQSVEMFARL